ncbi:MAG: RNA polymerase sigma factor [Ruminococcus sp.]|nr:RNA polymerase sigma factor [Ruminococcus sp.]MDE6784473.1 RNA polymerase sigma factor [Ruminococcus sp.]
MSLDLNEQYSKIYRYCYIRVNNRDTAEDLTQETFLRYLEHPKYHSIDKTLNLLYTIAGNLCTDYFRSHKSDELPEDMQSNENIENAVLESYALSQALKSLPSEDREIILLRYINDVPVGVIADIYHISRFALNRRIRKILAELRSFMGKEEL